jgi:hypothetical protein
MIRGRSNRGKQRIRSAVAALGCALLAGSAQAAVHIGGVDVQSEFTKPTAVSGTPGLFSFTDAFNSGNNPEPGVVTSSDLVGFNLIGVNARAFFDVILSPLQENDVTPFNPATNDINLASFAGATPTAFTIFQPQSNTGAGQNIPVDILLTFSVSFIDVTNARQASIIPGVDPDGQIKFGNPEPNDVTSLLTVTGGSLANLVGGVGTTARLEVLVVTPNPAILTKADLSGYFANNWTGGNAAQPVSATTWNLTIIPEPSTAALLGGALVALVAIARRRAL